MQVQVHPVHFEDFSGFQFERLAFAYLLRRPCYTHVDWYGQLGSDRGRDIVCDHLDGSTHIFQCANYRRLTFKKADDDLKKLALGKRSKDAHFRLIAGGAVSADMKDRVSTAAKNRKFKSCKTISGAEFEERLRRDTPDLLQRFTQGVEFPELPAELTAFAADAGSLTDEQIVAALTVAFDRPAYKTPFHMESSLPRFKKAIAETIDTLNTGRTPSGKVLPSKHEVKDQRKLAVINQLVNQLVGLRGAFDRLLKKGGIRHCNCGDPECPTFMMSHDAATEMDQRRQKMLNDVVSLNPKFDPSFYRFDD